MYEKQKNDSSDTDSFDVLNDMFGLEDADDGSVSRGGRTPSMSEMA